MCTLASLFGRVRDRVPAVLVGRSRSSDVILNDSRISSLHCRIFKGVEQQDGSHQMLIEDTSFNGTKIQRAGQVCRRPSLPCLRVRWAWTPRPR